MDLTLNNIYLDEINNDLLIRGDLIVEGDIKLNNIILEDIKSDTATITNIIATDMKSNTATITNITATDLKSNTATITNIICSTKLTVSDINNITLKNDYKTDDSQNILTNNISLEKQILANDYLRQVVMIVLAKSAMTSYTKSLYDARTLYPISFNPSITGGSPLQSMYE
jgi:hypothetical protein